MLTHNILDLFSNCNVTIILMPSFQGIYLKCISISQHKDTLHNYWSGIYILSDKILNKYNGS